MTEMPTRGWRRQQGWSAEKPWQAALQWAAGFVPVGSSGGRLCRHAKEADAELSAAQMSEGWNGSLLLLALSFPGEHLEKIIPLIVRYCNVEDDELREYCFQAFESFVRRWVSLRHRAPSRASVSFWCESLLVQLPGLHTFGCAFLLGMTVHERNLLHAGSWA